jgi:hypothetical protein
MQSSISLESNNGVGMASVDSERRQWHVAKVQMPLLMPSSAVESGSLRTCARKLDSAKTKIDANARTMHSMALAVSVADMRLDRWAQLTCQLDGSGALVSRCVSLPTACASLFSCYADKQLVHGVAGVAPIGVLHVTKCVTELTAPAPPPRVEFACSRCTYVNGAAAHACVMCDQPRPAVEASSSSSSSAAVDDGGAPRRRYNVDCGVYLMSGRDLEVFGLSDCFNVSASGAVECLNSVLSGRIRPSVVLVCGGGGQVDDEFERGVRAALAVSNGCARAQLIRMSGGAEAAQGAALVDARLVRLSQRLPVDISCAPAAADDDGKQTNGARQVLVRAGEALPLDVSCAMASANGALVEFYVGDAPIGRARVDAGNRLRVSLDRAMIAPLISVNGMAVPLSIGNASSPTSSLSSSSSPTMASAAIAAIGALADQLDIVEPDLDAASDVSAQLRNAIAALAEHHLPTLRETIHRIDHQIVPSLDDIPHNNDAAVRQCRRTQIRRAQLLLQRVHESASSVRGALDTFDRANLDHIISKTADA